jgi:L-fuculose-phosphate aldolase
MSAREVALRREIVRVCHLMYEKGLICATDGNVSARLAPNRLLLTPSGLHKGFITEEQIIVIDDEGNMAEESAYRPSSELPMHLEAYRQRPEIGGVVHAHPPITVALSIAGVPLDDYLLPEVIVMLGRIPVTEYATPSSEENARAIRALIVDHDGLVLRRHGSLTVGESPLHAFIRLETLEQNARIRYMVEQMGVEDPTLELSQVEKLLRQREQMGLLHPHEWETFRRLAGGVPA